MARAVGHGLYLVELLRRQREDETGTDGCCLGSGVECAGGDQWPWGLLHNMRYTYCARDERDDWLQINVCWHSKLVGPLS